MSNKIEEDDPMYATKHVKQVGLGWYFLIALLSLGGIITTIMASVEGQFSLWPAVFLIGFVVALSYVGRKLGENGYVYDKDRYKKDG